jgi:hypothetical protein
MMPRSLPPPRPSFVLPRLVLLFLLLHLLLLLLVGATIVVAGAHVNVLFSLC